jgi:Tfp pilus assembly protein PilV
MRPVSPTPAPLGSEAGSALVEVMVSATILVFAVIGLFLALDVQTSASGDARAASTAAGLAEQDQERLRSFPIRDLAGRNETRSVVLAGNTYSVVSTTDWVRDSTGGTQSCSSSSTPADYLRLTTTVTAPEGGATPPAPITLRSLVAAPVGQYAAGQGTLAVNTVGAAGQAIQGVTASISGPFAASATTNTLGCAVFGYIPVGTYQVQLSAANFVDPAGVASPTQPAPVSEGTVNLTSMQYDRQGTISVSFDTKVGTAAPVADTSSALTVANAGVPVTGTRQYLPGSPQGTIAATALFPFPSAYTVYSGTCAGANPATWDPSYFTTYPSAGSVVVAPGGAPSVTVREPALRVSANTQNNNTPVHFRVKSTDTGCADVFDWPSSGQNTGAGKTVTLPPTGLPFGTYDVCADDGTRRNSFTTTALRTPGGMPSVQNIDLKTGTTPGVCP